jgi:hypothetical protein
MSHETFLQCECDCRHLARWICRTCPDEFNPTQEKIEILHVDQITPDLMEETM